MIGAAKVIILTGGPGAGKIITIMEGSKRLTIPVFNPPSYGVMAEPSEFVGFSHVTYVPTGLYCLDMEYWQIELPKEEIAPLNMEVNSKPYYGCVWMFKEDLCQYKGAASSCDHSFKNCIALKNTQHFGNFLPKVLAAEKDVPSFSPMYNTIEASIQSILPDLSYQNDIGTAMQNFITENIPHISTTDAANAENVNMPYAPKFVQCPKHGKKLARIVWYDLLSTTFMCPNCYDESVLNDPFFLEEVKEAELEHPRNFRHIILEEEV